MNKKELGKFGEEAAAEYLKLQGYEILALNFRRRLGEVDIICKKDNQVVFCEVKTRTTDACGTPGEAVTEAKKDKIRKVAAVYMMWEKVTNYQVGFDVIEINCNHIENAF